MAKMHARIAAQMIFGRFVCFSFALWSDKFFISKKLISAMKQLLKPKITDFLDFVLIDVDKLITRISDHCETFIYTITQGAYQNRLQNTTCTVNN